VTNHHYLGEVARRSDRYHQLRYHSCERMDEGRISLATLTSAPAQATGPRLFAQAGTTCISGLDGVKCARVIHNTSCSHDTFRGLALIKKVPGPSFPGTANAASVDALTPRFWCGCPGPRLIIAAAEDSGVGDRGGALSRRASRSPALPDRAAAAVVDQQPSDMITLCRSLR
jgi:hypothetical protein